MASSQHANLVSNAVAALYNSPVPIEKERASKWLGEFQRSIFAWETADQLLREKRDVESTYFAAQTIRTKILYSFQELPQTSHESLKGSLLNHIELLFNFSPVLIKQLALAICDLALQMPDWKLPTQTFIEKYSKNFESLSYLFDLLIVLPEEVNNKSLRLGANRRADILEQMETSGPMVVDLIVACIDKCQDEKLLTKVFQCLSSWFNLNVLPGNYVSRCNVLDAPFQVLGNVSTSSTMYEAACDCVCSAQYAVEDVVRNNDLISILFEKTVALRETYLVAVSMEDTDKCLGLCRVFTEMAESLLDMLINMPGEGLGDLVTLDILLMCAGHCQYEVVDITFNYWYRLSEALYTQDRQISMHIFGPFIQRFIISLVRHCQMEPDHEGLLDSADDFYDFRQNAADLVRDIVYIIGPTDCFGHLFSMLMSNSINGSGDGQTHSTVSWDVTESVLFIMAAFAKNVKSDDVSVVPRVLEAVVSLPSSTHIALRHTSVMLVGELSAWIEKHPQTLDHTLQFLSGILQVSELSSVGAISVQYLCEVCQAQMIKHYSALLELVKISDDLKMTNDAILGLLKGVSSVVSCLDQSQVQEALHQLLMLQIAGLNSLNHHHAENHKSHKDPVIWLDRIATVFRHVNFKNQTLQENQHPFKAILEEMWPSLCETLNNYQTDNKSVERWCRCLRFAVRCVGFSVATTILPNLASAIVEVYKQHSHSCFLYLGSVLVDVYGKNHSASEVLLKMLNEFLPSTLALVNKDGGLQDNPDTVDDLFRLCNRFVEQCPHQFMSHGACAQIIQLALTAISLDHRDANSSVTKFLKSVIESNARLPNTNEDIVTAILRMFGEELVQRSLHACLFSLPTYLYPDIAELWWSIMERDKQVFGIWLQEALKKLPSDATLARATHEQILQFHRESMQTRDCKKCGYLLRDFCRLYR